MTELRFKLGDRVLALGRPGTVSGFFDPENPGEPSYPYYVDVPGESRKMLYADRELEPMPDKGSDSVWEAMAYSYWENWRQTQNELDELKLKIRGLIEDAFA